MTRKRIRKSVDETHRIHCKDGSIGTLREEVYVDERNTLTKYNLAFINPSLFPRDNGRILGYDNAHSRHERYFKGDVEEVLFTTYAETLESFLNEVAQLKETL